MSKRRSLWRGEGLPPHLAGSLAVCSLEVPAGPRAVRRLAEEWVGGFLSGSRKSSTLHARPDPPGLQQEEERVLSPRADQRGLEGQSHEVIRGNRDCRRPKAGTLGHSCFSRVKATAPSLLPQPGVREESAPCAAQLEVMEAPLPRLSLYVGFGQRASCCRVLVGSTEPLFGVAAGLQALGAVRVPASTL